MAVEEPGMTVMEVESRNSRRKRKEQCSGLWISGNDKVSGKNLNIQKRTGMT
jgi:hypothetical protein